MITVTKPFLPPKEEYQKYIDGIWEKRWLTNMGPLSLELESKLQTFLNVKSALFVTNGTIALQIAIKALDLQGDIITTPFSFVATTSSIVWESCTPVFVDIDENTLNIDPSKIEEAITEKTSAILATHVYGNPCNVYAIEAIAKKHNLKVIYDAAHCFGVELNGESIFNFGDISICSLHATKLYHSVEGGLIFSSNNTTIKRISVMRNFGFNGPESFDGLGINGKNSELHAAMGLANLKYVPKIIQQRKHLSERYNENLKTFRASTPSWNINASNNFAYYPLLIESEELLLKCVQKLKEHNIHTRRYFFPSLAKSLPYVSNKELVVVDDISPRILCLPLYFDLKDTEVDTICSILLNV
jgi:dTDP-4-amino-4,6-dideoxygalactose transaminase